ncbi:DUF6461 domain-containing protein [Streptomyces sp. TRM 70361]|uniref:DUF6461 domain-containing protein n=1 Tax=Streptomyces sp. TRM 70361 TaxID=3116553 RepID=UPI002E7B5784|nr:DUF6461 domain-containing protein [Streptomyces sp. TRM 70361]MEE1938139.1 DUF6461 domain-containing protein [Streptomyces sp. TRM 70361]
MISSENLSWTYDELVCLNLVRGKTPGGVLRHYAAAPSQAWIMTRQQADREFGHHPDSGTVLRAGLAGSWSFCLENWEPVGFGPGILERLSSGTDAIHYLRNPQGGDLVEHLRDGDIVQSFELGVPGPLPRQAAPLGLAEAFRRGVSTRPYGDDGYDEIWAVLSDLTGVPLDDGLVNGPLPTVLRRNPHV